MANLDKYVEFETKYRCDSAMLIEFKRIMDSLPGLVNFLYVEGPDLYFTNEHVLNRFINFAENLEEKDKESLLNIINETVGQFPPFVRYRRPSHGLDGDRKEVTTKYKQDGVKNNIQREEKNIRVDRTDEDTIKAFISDLGYKLNFSIHKACHIYRFEDATLVFYTVYDTTDGRPSKMDSFIEIEVSEEKVASLTEEQAWEIVSKYEKALEPVGITSKNRLKKSLFEMYKR